VPQNGSGVANGPNGVSCTLIAAPVAILRCKPAHPFCVFARGVWPLVRAIAGYPVQGFPSGAMIAPGMRNEPCCEWSGEVRGDRTKRPSISFSAFSRPQ
jgi:hypothetical protein